MSYNAVVAKIHTRPLPGADKLGIGDVLGYNVIVGIDTPQDALGIFFEAGGQLSDAFCKANNLYRIKDADGKDIAGMFEENRRVKCIKLRGAKSEGFWIPLESVAFTGHSLEKLKEGDAFDSLNDVPICCKYETEKQKKGAANQQIKVRKNNPMMVKWVETEAFKKFGGNIPTGAYIMLSEKVHGCVSGDTVVDTLEYGEVSISEIVDDRLPSHIKSLDTISGDIVYAEVDDFYLKRNHGEWYELELEDGTILKITGNNPVWLPELKVYRRVDLLQVGNTLLLD